MDFVKAFVCGGGNMCSYADSYGKDKAYAGKDNGHSCNNRSCTWSSWNI